MPWPCEYTRRAESKPSGWSREERRRFGSRSFSATSRVAFACGRNRPSCGELSELPDERAERHLLEKSGPHGRRPFFHADRDQARRREADGRRTSFATSESPSLPHAPPRSPRGARKACAASSGPRLVVRHPDDERVDRDLLLGCPDHGKCAVRAAHRDPLDCRDRLLETRARRDAERNQRVREAEEMMIALLVRAVTIAIAADAIRGFIPAIPAIEPIVIEPDTSSARRCRFFVGVRSPNDA